MRSKLMPGRKFKDHAFADESIEGVRRGVDGAFIARVAVRKIQKYANRKLYDTFDARYISMVELAEVVWRGGDVEVTDDRTGHDVTAEVLARALYERVKLRYGSGQKFLVKEDGIAVELLKEKAKVRQLLATLIRQVSLCRRIASYDERKRS
jgi:hypothetical protein